MEVNMNTKWSTQIFFYWMFALVFGFISCSEGDSKRTKESVQSKEHKINLSSINYSILRQWNPNNNPDSFGAEILLQQELTKEEIISFIKRLSLNKDPVKVNIYTIRAAYEQEKSGNYGKEYKEGFLLVYIKNFTGKGTFRGFNEIRWMQEIGKFSHLFGQKTKL
jgi:hypothetical protein